MDHKPRFILHRDFGPRHAPFTEPVDSDLLLKLEASQAKDAALVRIHNGNLVVRSTSLAIRSGFVDWYEVIVTRDELLEQWPTRTTREAQDIADSLNAALQAIEEGR